MIIPMSDQMEGEKRESNKICGNVVELLVNSSLPSCYPSLLVTFLLHTCPFIPKSTLPRVPSFSYLQPSPPFYFIHFFYFSPKILRNEKSGRTNGGLVSSVHQFMVWFKSSNFRFYISRYITFYLNL